MIALFESTEGLKLGLRYEALKLPEAEFFRFVEDNKESIQSYIQMEDAVKVIERRTGITFTSSMNKPELNNGDKILVMIPIADNHSGEDFEYGILKVGDL